MGENIRVCGPCSFPLPCIMIATSCPLLALVVGSTSLACRSLSLSAAPGIPPHALRVTPVLHLHLRPGLGGSGAPLIERGVGLRALILQDSSPHWGSRSLVPVYLTLPFSHPQSCLPMPTATRVRSTISEGRLWDNVISMIPSNGYDV